MADRPYVRVYHADMIRDHSDVWDDDAALAAWLRLLVLADGSWPAPAELPRSIKDRSVASLVKSKLLAMVGQHRYSITGLDAERSQRQDAARNAAALRWHGKGNAPRNAETMPSRAEPSRAEPSSSPPADGEDQEDEVRRWLAKHGCYIRPGNGYDQKLVVAVTHHGSNALIGMMDRLASAGTLDGDIKGFLFGAIDELDKRARPSLAVLEAEDRDEERREAMGNRIAATKRRVHEAGGHVEPNPGCPDCEEASA